MFAKIGAAPKAPPKPTQTTDIAAVVKTEVDRQLKTMRASMEKLQALTGERGPRDGSAMAVVRGEIGAIGDVTMTASTLTIAPTAADYNKLLTDVQNVVALLERVRDTFVARE